MGKSSSEKSLNKELISDIWQQYLTSGVQLKKMELPWYEHPFFKPIFRAIPAEPRCHHCYIPFAGIGGFLSRKILDVKPSIMNPHICNTCERFGQRYAGGTEIEVSILFADIRGSTQIAEKMGPQEYSDLIQRFYLAGTKSLYTHDALIEKFIGDGLSAFFAPAFAGPNHALAAIKAGKELLKATGHQEGIKPWVPVGVGINTGVAFIGSIKGDGGRNDITLLGDVVNTSARLSSLSAAGEILVGDRTIALSGVDSTNYESKDLSLRGKEESVKVWSIKTPE